MVRLRNRGVFIPWIFPYKNLLAGLFRGLPQLILTPRLIIRMIVDFNFPVSRRSLYGQMEADKDSSQEPIILAGLDWDWTLTRSRNNKPYNVNARAYAVRELIKDGFAVVDGYDPAREIDPALSKEDFLHQVFGRSAAVDQGVVYIKKFYADMMHRGEIVEDEGARETLRFLSEQGSFFIASDNPALRMRQRFDYFFGKDFPYVPVIGTEEGLPEKPRPEMLERGFNILNPDGVPAIKFYIGDRVSKDVVAAIRAGAVPVLYGSPVEEPKADSGVELIKIHGVPTAVVLEGVEYPLIYAETHEQIRREIFNYRAQHTSKNCWWRGLWWENEPVLDEVISFAHQIVHDDDLRDAHLIMLGGGLSWLSFAASQFVNPEERLVINLPFSTKKSSIELKRSGFADKEKGVAKFIVPPDFASEKISEEEAAYRKLLIACRLDPVRMVNNYRKTGRQFAFVDSIGKGKCLPTFTYFMGKWAKEEAERRDPRFLDDFMDSIRLVGIAGTAECRKPHEDYELFDTFVLEGGSLPKRTSMGIKMYVHSVCKMMDFAEYPRVVPKYPYIKWSRRPYFKTDKSWLEGGLVSHILAKICERIETGTYGEHVRSPVRTLSQFLGRQKINALIV
jgi:phosphoglycolate phosphatase-like HAD superfamily hydrolase